MRKQLGSEKYGTQEMREEEVLLFVEAAVEGGASISDAVQDMRFIDTCLKMKKIHFAMGKEIRTTQSGNLRKGSTLYNQLDHLLEARVNGAFNY